MTMKFLFSFFLLATLPSCLYHMPGPDEVSTVPIVNNPNIYQDRGPASMPGVGV
jgi:hypothetical protein